MAKGGQFERDIATQLSTWWTNGQSDSCFWRSSQSGGRATTREKQGKKTLGQYGDIAVTEPDGQMLIELVSIELKRGYNDRYPLTLVDKSPKAAQQGFDKFLEQASGDSERAGVPFWWLIHKRDRREIMLYFPFEFYEAISSCMDSLAFSSSMRVESGGRDIMGVLWEEFLVEVDSRSMRRLWRYECSSKK